MSSIEEISYYGLLKELEEQLQEKCSLVEKAEAEITSLQQKVSDNRQDMKLHEKKGASLVSGGVALVMGHVE